MTQTEWEVAKAVCTERQVQVLDLRRQGLGFLAIAHTLGLREDVVRGEAESGLERARRFAAPGDYGRDGVPRRPTVDPRDHEVARLVTCPECGFASGRHSGICRSGG